MSEWAKQRSQKLHESHDDMKAADSMLDLLLSWITGAENTLNKQETEPVPENIPIIEQLMNDHQVLGRPINVPLKPSSVMFIVYISSILFVSMLRHFDPGMP